MTDAAQPPARPSAPPSGPPSAPPSGPPSGPPALVALVHGAWHGAWCWATLQAELDRRGVPSLAIDLPGHGASTDALGGLHDHATAVVAVLDRLAERDAGPVVLVGHSYGGAVITQAAVDRDDVAHLLYLAAFALDDGESVLGCLGSLERHDVDLGAAMIMSADGRSSTLDATLAAGALYGDCPPEAVGAALRRLGPQSSASMTEETAGAGRSRTASTYVVCSRDRAVHPVHQNALAARCDHRIEIDTDHSPFLSAVAATADIVEQIANGR